MLDCLETAPLQKSDEHVDVLFKQIRTMVGRLDFTLNTVAECAFD